MKIACISDTHGLFLPEIPEGVDFVLHAGDIAPDKNPRTWISGPFSEWASELDARNIGVFCTFGNHDFWGERMSESQIEEFTPENVTFCKDEHIYIKDEERDQTLSVWFSPWSTLFGDWAFMETDRELRKRYDEIPPEVDIIVSHGPPKGYGDRTLPIWTGRAENVGSASLLDAFLRTEARYLVCGHIHEGYGTYLVPTADGTTPKTVINCAQVNEEYQPVYNAVKIIDIKP